MFVVFNSLEALRLQIACLSLEVAIVHYVRVIWKHPVPYATSPALAATSSGNDGPSRICCHLMSLEKHSMVPC